jgi:serine/threonine protein kinase
LEQYSANSKKGSYTDIYSFGATFYFALTGEKPMDAVARTTETMPAAKFIL